MIILTLVALPFIILGIGVLYDTLRFGSSMIAFFVGIGLLLIGILILIKIFNYLLKTIRNFDTVSDTLDNIANNEKVENIQVDEHSKFSSLAKDINVIKDNLETSYQEQLKAERMKSELISNVSHDLRTPLTSIITYTDLLKNNNISTEDKNKYLNIIDMKSQKLKVLIDDLFEVSKMMSGDVTINKMKIDIIQLYQQTLAENEEQIEKEKLTFVNNYSEKPIYIKLDGHRFSRVFDNIISNIIKYSQKSTRVYVDFVKEDNNLLIQFRNTSKYQLDSNVDELVERFKRADASRSSEGSGLGLAIADSIVKLHDGQISLSADGDLFKVEISLPLINEKQD
jgi:signal transduction histidine kinase